MISSAEALEQLNKWKSASTKLFFNSLAGGMQAWCEGTLKHVSSGSLQFGRDDVDEPDLLFVVTLDDATFAFVDNRETSQFWGAGRTKAVFGSVLEITLHRGARVVFAEFFPRTIETPPE
jgi:hypothetical protein